MQRYKSKSNKSSGVTGFEIKANGILVEFKEVAYLYTYKSAGKKAIEKMKKLALSQDGLSTFISQNGPPYESKYLYSFN
jgi:hypothetical protein